MRLKLATLRYRGFEETVECPYIVIIGIWLKVDAGEPAMEKWTHLDNASLNYLNY